ncbi:MAG: nucleotidyltransferase family protein [Deferrisomatales bacterium]|nr:nucleotidyltransferase family protein [Deferrisomatales bacterium]
MTAGVLLAAGASRRMGTGSKLLALVGGAPVVRHGAENLLAAGLAPLVVVLGAAEEGVREALSGLEVRCVRNPDHGRGMASSIVAGVGSLGPEVDTLVLGLGDMPGVRPATVLHLLRAFRDSRCNIAVPVYHGVRGHPVVFGLGAHRAGLLRLRGDAGARSMLAAHAADVLSVPVTDPGVRIDVDTPADLAALQASGVPTERHADRRVGPKATDRKGENG